MLVIVCIKQMLDSSGKGIGTAAYIAYYKRITTMNGDYAAKVSADLVVTKDE